MFPKSSHDATFKHMTFMASVRSSKTSALSLFVMDRQDLRRRNVNGLNGQGSINSRVLSTLLSRLLIFPILFLSLFLLLVFDLLNRVDETNNINQKKTLKISEQNFSPEKKKHLRILLIECVESTTHS